MRHRLGAGPRRTPDVVEVLLIEGDEAEDASAASQEAEPTPGDHEGRPAGRSVRRSRVLRWSAGVAAALLVVVGVNEVESRRDAARIAALAGFPEFLLPVEAPPTEVWRVPGRLKAAAGGLMMLADPAGRILRAVDPATGQHRWAVSGRAGSAANTGYCLTLDEEAYFGLAVSEPGPPPAPEAPVLLACVADPPGGLRSGQARTPELSVLIIDATTGGVLRSFEAQGSLVAAQPVGRDLLIALAVADGRLRLVRWDPGAGETRWEHVSELSVFPDDPLMIEAIERRSGSFLVRAIGTVAVDLANGTALDPEEAAAGPLWYQTRTLPGGGTVVWQEDALGTGGRGVVVDPDGHRLFSLPGPPLTAATHDGSQPGILVTASPDRDRLRGIDLRTSRWLWSVPVRSGYGLLQVDGVLVVRNGSDLTAVDVADGEVLWTEPIDPATFGPGLTDGRLVLVPQRVDGDRTLAGVDLYDGEEIWRTGLPQATRFLTVEGGRLLAGTGEEVVGLG